MEDLKIKCSDITHIECKEAWSLTVDLSNCDVEEMIKNLGPDTALSYIDDDYIKDYLLDKGLKVVDL